MEDSMLGSCNRVDRPSYQILSCRCQNLTPYKQSETPFPRKIRTWIQTSSGTSPFVMRPLTKLKSVSLAAGYATSICLTPHLINWRKNVVFCSMVIGFARAWLPSRRSVDNHIGALVNVFEGHSRLGRFRGVYGRYFCEGSALKVD